MKSTYMYIWQVAYYQFFFIPLKILQYAKSTEILNTGSRGWGWGVLRSFGGGEGREGVWVQTLLENSNLLNLHSKVTENRPWHFLGKRNYPSDPPWKNFSLSDSVHGLHWLWPGELPKLPLSQWSSSSPVTFYSYIIKYERWFLFPNL